jgi:tetratricopeptide (TPR) repeat protein
MRIPRACWAVVGVVFVLSSSYADEPKTAEEFSNRGNDYLEKKKYDSAIADYTKAIELNPKDAIAFHNRGGAYFNKEKYALAVADYQEALRLDPKYESALKYQKEAIKELRESGKQPEVLSVTLDEEMKSVTIKKSSPYKLATNSEKVVEDTIRVKHEVTVKEGWKAEDEVRGTFQAWLVEVQIGIRGSIEKSTSRTYGTETPAAYSDPKTTKLKATITAGTNEALVLKLSRRP